MVWLMVEPRQLDSRLRTALFQGHPPAGRLRKGSRFGAIREVPGAQCLRSGRTYEQDGVTPRWRGIDDDKGRLMVAICHNLDPGDSWEHADNPQYDQNPRSASAIGVNDVNAMTH
jgi:Domain of unknown function (DUF4159)